MNDNTGVKHYADVFVVSVRAPSVTLPLLFGGKARVYWTTVAIAIVALRIDPVYQSLSTPVPVGDFAPSVRLDVFVTDVMAMPVFFRVVSASTFRLIVVPVLLHVIV